MPEPRLRHLSAAKQRRLDSLMTAHNEGRLTPVEHDELRERVGEAEAIALSNARKLARRRRSLPSVQGK